MISELSLVDFDLPKTEPIWTRPERIWFSKDCKPAEGVARLHAERGERLRHVIVPGETLLIRQRPEHAQAGGGETQARRGEPDRSLATVDRRSVEVDQPQTS